MVHVKSTVYSENLNPIKLLKDLKGIISTHDIFSGTTAESALN